MHEPSDLEAVVLSGWPIRNPPRLPGSGGDTGHQSMSPPCQFRRSSPGGPRDHQQIGYSV